MSSSLAIASPARPTQKEEAELDPLHLGGYATFRYKVLDLNSKKSDTSSSAQQSRNPEQTMGYLLNSLLSSQQRAQADAADAAMLNLNGLRAERALLHIAAQAIDASQRPGFDADYGSYTQNPADPRHVADEEVGDMLEAINCAEQSLHMARQALEGYGNKVSTLTARSLFNEAREYLEQQQ